MFVCISYGIGNNDGLVLVMFGENGFNGKKCSFGIKCIKNGFDE